MDQNVSDKWKPRALVVDDTEGWREIFEERLKMCGWRVDTVDNIPDALRLIRDGNHLYQAAIVDKGGSGRFSGLPDKIGHRDGLRVLNELKRQMPECIRVLATGERWNPGAFTDPQVFYDKTSGEMSGLTDLLDNWRPREDGLPYLFLFESSGRRERR